MIITEPCEACSVQQWNNVKFVQLFNHWTVWSGFSSKYLQLYFSSFKVRLPKPNLPLDFSSQTYFSHELSVFFSVRGNFSWDTVVLHIFRKYCWDRPSTIMQCLCRKRKLRRRQFPHHCLRVVLKIDKRKYIVSQDAILYKNVQYKCSCELRASGTFGI